MSFIKRLFGKQKESEAAIPDAQGAKGVEKTETKLKSVDRAAMQSIKMLMESLPVAPSNQVEVNFRSCQRAWGQMSSFSGQGKSVISRLETNLKSVTRRPGFSYFEAKKGPGVRAADLSQNTNEFLGVMTFVGNPTYAYPHHIWRTGEDEYSLWPSEVIRG
jgi:hypothetical protein